MPLNYDASVPGIDDGGKSAPFVVKVDPNKPPGLRFKDFVPKEAQAPPTKPTDVIARKQAQQYRRPVARYGDDYISGNDSAARRKNEKSKIMELAKEIYAANAKHRKVFQQAEKMVSSASKSDLQNPDAELQRALKIVKRHKPMTKEDAVSQATQQFYGLMN